MSNMDWLYSESQVHDVGRIGKFDPKKEAFYKGQYEYYQSQRNLCRDRSTSLAVGLLADYRYYWKCAEKLNKKVKDVVQNCS